MIVLAIRYWYYRYKLYCCLDQCFAMPSIQSKLMTKFHLLAPYRLLSQFWLQNRNLPVWIIPDHV